MVEGVFGRRVWREIDDSGDPETRQWDRLESKPDSSATCQQNARLKAFEGHWRGPADCRTVMCSSHRHSSCAPILPDEGDTPQSPATDISYPRYRSLPPRARETLDISDLKQPFGGGFTK
jgi:hypothetical protein